MRLALHPCLIVTLFDGRNRPLEVLRMDRRQLNAFWLDQLFKPWQCPVRAARIEITA